MNTKGHITNALSQTTEHESNSNITEADHGYKMGNKKGAFLQISSENTNTKRIKQ